MLLGIESFISIVTGFVGFLVVFLIAFSYRSNSLMNIYLLIGFIIVSIRLLHNGLNGFYENPTLNKIISIITPLLLSGIPSLYLYFQNLFYHQNRFRKRDLLHFIYPLSLFILLLLPIDFKQVQNFYRFVILLGSLMVMAITYTFLSVRIIYINVWKGYAKNKIDATVQQRLLTKWTTFLIISEVLVSIRLLLSVIYEAQLNEAIFGYSFTAVQGVLWLIIFLMILVHPEILYGYAKLQRHVSGLNEPEKTVQESIWNSESEPVSNTQDAKLQEVILEKLTGYFLIIDEFVATQKPFSNKKYALKDMALDLKIPASHLTFIFKYHCKLSFTEFKNYSRVKHSLELMAEDFLDSKTFEAMAEAVGFSTYNTFYIAFKAHTGLSPKDFYFRDPPRA